MCPELSDSLDLSNKLDELPQHKAPDIWSNIEAELDKTAVAPEKSNMHLTYLKIAGVIILLLSAALVYLLTKEGSTSDQGYQYRSEMAMASTITETVEIDNDLDNLLAFIENNGSAFTADELEDFQEQLLEINTAIERILELQSTYGKDESSIKLLAQMERDKSDLLKSIIVKAS